MHGLNDVLNMNNSLKYELNPFGGKLTLTVGLNEIVSSNRILMFGIDHRKCLFETEMGFEHLNPIGKYTQNLCLISCRIENALKMCNCRPLFYQFGKLNIAEQIWSDFLNAIILKIVDHRPICNVTGM